MADPNELEPRTRTPAMADTLQGRIRDPLWMLARQMQFGELIASDGGSAVRADLKVECAPITRYRPGTTAQAHVYDRSLPLEAIVEREEPIPQNAVSPLGRIVEGGTHFLRLLSAHGMSMYADAYRARYPISRAAHAPPGALDPDGSARVLDVVAGRVPDADALFRDLAAAGNALPAAPVIAAADQARVLEAAGAWVAWYRGGGLSVPGEVPSAWLPDRMEYGFSVAARTSEREIVLDAPEYFTGHLDWPSFVVNPLAPPMGTPATDVVTTSVSVMPAPVTYRGMPAARLWEFEDGRVNFADMEAGLREQNPAALMLMEFALVYGNDWLLLPVEVAVGSLCQVRSLTVIDTFGDSTVVRSAGAEDGPGSPWRMFALSAVPGGAAPPEDVMLLAPTLGPGLSGPPVEDVLFMRDEMANVGWAIERVVQSAIARRVDRHEAYQDQVRRQAGSSPTPQAAGMHYRLGSTVPDHWIPLVPEPGNGKESRLRRGTLPRATGGRTQPVGQILEPGTELSLFDEEVPREGARVTRSHQYARWTDGSFHAWIGRRKTAGSGEGSSGLRFDFIEGDPRPPVIAPSSTVSPVVAGTAQVGQTLSVVYGPWAGTQPITIAYQWRRCDASGQAGTDIPDATRLRYLLVAADLGKTVRVKVTATNAGGSSTLTSAPTATVGPAVTVPACTAVPSITGTAQVGQRLTANPGTWSGSPAPGLVVQWRRCDTAGQSCVDIPGATSDGYTLVAADEGKTVLAVVTATNAAGSVSAASSPTGVVGAPVHIAGATIAALAVVGSPLPAVPGKWSGTAPITFAYQWRRITPGGLSTEDIVGATAASYTPVPGDVGSTIQLAVTATNPLGSATFVTDPTAVVGAPVHIAGATIAALAVVGSPLPAIPGKWSGTEPITFAYQWRRITPGGLSTEDIVGATAASYTPVPADVGSTIQLAVTATNPLGSATTVTDPTGVVAAPPANTVPPSIAGTAQVGQTLTASPGTWSGTPAPTYAYQWQRGDAAAGSPVAIAGATASAYTVVSADVGATLRVLVTASNIAGASSVVSPSSPVVLSNAPRNVSPPVIRGEPYAGSLLTVDEGTWSGATPTSFAYQWVRCDSGGQGGVDIPGATERDYVPKGRQDQPDGPPPDVVFVVSQTSDVGSTLRVRVVATAPGGSATVLSGPTPLISDQPRDPTS